MKDQKNIKDLAKIKLNLKLIAPFILILAALTGPVILTSCDFDWLSNNKTDTETDNNNEALGAVTGEPLSDPQSIAKQVLAIENELRPQFEDTWFSRLDNYVNQYRNSAGSPDPLEALFGLMFASVLEDNVYPFCILAIRALQIEPDNPLAINSMAACLLRINKIQLAGLALDVAYDIAPDLYLTWENAAVWFHTNGRVDDAISAMNNAMILEGNSAFTAWSAAEYAAWNGRSAAVNDFRSLLPTNYPLQNSDGTIGGKAPAKQCYFCGCSNTYYDNLRACTANCTATLGCFTQICTPSNCCGDRSPFSLKAEICFPPTGVQACLSANTQGDVTISVQTKLAELVKLGIRGKLSFTGGELKTGISVYGSVATGLAEGVGVSIDLLSGKVASSFSGSYKLDKASFGLSLGLPTMKEWTLILLCALE